MSTLDRKALVNRIRDVGQVRRRAADRNVSFFAWCYGATGPGPFCQASSILPSRL